MQLFAIRNQMRTIFVLSYGQKFTTFQIILTKRKFIEYLLQLLYPEIFHNTMVGGKKL